MKRTISLLALLIIFLSACASPTPSTSVSASEPAEVVSVESTATTSSPEPTSTNTPVPPSPHWYWALDSETLKVVAVNQFGETRELGAVDAADDLHTSSISLDNERALLFLDADNNLRVYLLTPDGMQKIALPSDAPYYDTESSSSSRAVLAIHEDHVVFSYVTDGGSNIMPDQGPIFLIDLTSLTATLIDKSVSRGPYTDNSKWLHISQDGRYLRYLNSDQGKMEIRELDLVTGDTNTLYTTSGSSYYIYASPQGDLWYLHNSKLIWETNGNQIDFTDELQTIRPLENGRAIVYPQDCVDDCELKVITPFGNEAEFTYHFPWVIEFGTFYNNLNQLLPDQNLLFAGKPHSYLSDTPAAAETYPSLLGEDIPIFRLAPDGRARLLGTYVEDFFTSNISANGQYILMKSIDQSSFFIYDVLADQPLFDMPVNPDLEGFFATVRFFDTGIVVNLEASVSGEQDAYRNFYHVYSYKTSNALTWEDGNREYSGCPDLFEDVTIVCWLYTTDNSFDLVRYDPATGTKTILLENAWPLDFNQ